MVAWWKAKGRGRLNRDLDFRWLHGGRQWGENFNKELDFRWSHGGRQGGEKERKT